jgi:hypothetical protein
MPFEYSPPVATMARGRGQKIGDRGGAKEDGVTDDWGKTRPYWCLSCGCGYRSVERVLAHYSEAGHGNESMSVGTKGLTKKQQLEAFKLRNR